MLKEPMTSDRSSWITAASAITTRGLIAAVTLVVLIVTAGSAPRRAC
jgi:hypothetical protein